MLESHPDLHIPVCVCEKEGEREGGREGGRKGESERKREK